MDIWGDGDLVIVTLYLPSVGGWIAFYLSTNPHICYWRVLPKGRARIIVYYRKYSQFEHLVSLHWARAIVGPCLGALAKA
jgi:hypothetical protein